VVSAWPYKSSIAMHAFIAATLLCGVSLADEAHQFCGECHYEDQSGGLDLSVLEPGNRDNSATRVRMLDRLAAGEMPPRKRTKNRPAPSASRLSTTPFHLL
jgi:hypothetical protein